MRNYPKWSDTLKNSCRKMQQDFDGVLDHFVTLCIRLIPKPYRPKIVRHTLQILQQIMQDFERVFYHFETFSLEKVRLISNMK